MTCLVLEEFEFTQTGNMFATTYPFTVLLVCLLCGALIAYAYADACAVTAAAAATEPFKCASTFTHAFGTTDPTDPNEPPAVESSAFTTLVPVPEDGTLTSGDTPPGMHNNTVCAATGIEVRGLQAIPNGELQPNDSVYVYIPDSSFLPAEYKNRNFPATVVGIYKPGDVEVVRTKQNLPASHKVQFTDPIAPIQVEPNPHLFATFYRKTSSHPSYAYGLQTVFQNPYTMRGTDILTADSKRNQSGEPGQDTVAVVFDDPTIQAAVMEHYGTAATGADGREAAVPYIFPLSQIKRLASQGVVDQCARNCVQMYPDTWGIQTGKCNVAGVKNGKAYSVCSCACIVPKEVNGQCTHGVLRSTELQSALNNNEAVDLHKINRNTVAQQQMLGQLEADCKHRGFQKPVSFPCEQVATGSDALPPTTDTATCCPNRCSAYTGQLREMCNDKSQLQDFLNGLPKVVSMGQPFCPKTAAGKPSRTSPRCAKDEDSPCSYRTDSQCAAYNHPTNIYKCAWHNHTPGRAGDTYATGCYDQDECISASGSRAKCGANPKCKYQSNGVCVDVSFCPTACTTLQSEEDCKANPFCRYARGKCKHATVYDSQEFKATYLTKPVSTSPAKHTLFKTNQPYKVKSESVSDIWNKE